MKRGEAISSREKEGVVGSRRKFLFVFRFFYYFFQAVFNVFSTNYSNFKKFKPSELST